MHFFNNLFNDNNRRNRNGRDSRTSRESRRTAGNGSGSGSAVNDNGNANVNTNVNTNGNTNANGANTTSGNTDSNQQSRSQPQESENNNGNRGPFDRLAEAIFASQQGRAQGNTPSGGGAGGSVSAGGSAGGGGGSQGGRGGSPWQQFEHLFQHAQAQAAAQASQQQASQQQQHVDEPSRAPPPASTKAIRQLPLVSVTPSDLVDENNRECCICFDEHCIHDKVIRLPCAHIYHPHCITEWLTKHGTCPVCRYELPTDNVVYERERKRRMKAQGRKPRYARYELERMKVKQLKELCVRLDIVPMREIAGLERKEFMDVIMKSGKIIVIAAPDPIEYPNIQGLRDMGVGKLKRAMNDAGVFFDSRDVVEKEDMVQIFVNSGRIVFAEVEGDGEGEGEQDGVLDSDDVNMDGDNNNNLVKDPYGNVYGQAQSQGRDNNEKDDNDYDYDIDNAKDDEEDNAIVEQTKRARIDENGNDNSARSPFNESSRNDSNEVMDVVEDGGAGADVNAHTHDDTVQSIDTDADADADEVATASMQVQEEISEEHAPLLSTDRESERERECGRPDIAARETVIAEGGASSTATATTQQGGVSSTNYSSSSSSHTSVAGAAGSSQSEQTAAVTTEIPSFAKRSIGELRQLADSLNVDISGCIEKREIIELISAVVCNNQ